MEVEIDDVLAYDRCWRGITEGESEPATFIPELVELVRRLNTRDALKPLSIMPVSFPSTRSSGATVQSNLTRLWPT